MECKPTESCFVQKLPQKQKHIKRLLHSPPQHTKPIQDVLYVHSEASSVRRFDIEHIVSSGVLGPFEHFGFLLAKRSLSNVYSDFLMLFFGQMSRVWAPAFWQVEDADTLKVLGTIVARLDGFNVCRVALEFGRSHRHCFSRLFTGLTGFEGRLKTDSGAVTKGIS